MKASPRLFSDFIRRQLKIQSWTFAFICTFCFTEAIWGNAFHSVNAVQTRKDSSAAKVSCRITDQMITIRNTNTTIRLNNRFECELYFQNAGENYQLTDQDKRSETIYLTDTSNNRIGFKRKSADLQLINDKFGKGKSVRVEGISVDGKIICSLSLNAYDKFPNVILVSSSFKNISGKNYPIRNYTLNHFYLHPPSSEKKWWTFQGASYYWAQDFAFKLPDSFRRENYFGLNDARVGSGIPLIDVWNRNYGLALAYLGEKPRDLYLPVKAENGRVQMSVQENYKNQILKPNDKIVSAQTALLVHHNDFYDPLQMYSRLMKPFLPDFKKPVDYGFESEWCTWGYRRDFKPEEVIAKLPQLKAMGIKSVILDDGWSRNHGDWIPDSTKFPNPDEDFKKLIDKIHASGLKVWIWWLPGYADSISQLAVQHSDWLVKNKDGTTHLSYALCPAYAPVQEFYKSLVKKFVADYKLDGLKLDFQEINSAPPCYNPAHHHQDALDSYHSTPALFKNIYETAVKYNPDMLIEYCSCGIPPSIFHLPWVNLAVTSDPGIAQITQRVKMYKALMGNDFPVLEEYCGVLAGPLYPLTIGTGGVPGSFSTSLDVSQENWLKIYKKIQLSRGGQYLNLYDIGFDFPEGHVIKKGRKFYYAFYTHPWKLPDPTLRVYRFGTEFDSEATTQKEFKYQPESYSGELNLRGLDKNKTYRVFDYVNKKEVAIIKGNDPYLKISFNDYVLLEVSPMNSK